MSQQQRLQQILSYVEEHKSMTVEEAVKAYHASPATIRRDFNLLTQRGQLDKMWGGVMAASNAQIVDSRSPVRLRKTQFHEEKVRIAKAAADLVKDGDVIIIDGGTTTLEMATFLANKRIQVITNSILIAQKIDEINANAGIEVFLTGGLLYSGSASLVGPHASEIIHSFHAKWLFLSTGGVSDFGVTNSNVLVVETERAMIKQCEKKVMLSDHSKIGKNDLVKLCDISDLDILITNETDQNGAMLDQFRKSGLEVIAC